MKNFFFLSLALLLCFKKVSCQDCPPKIIYFVVDWSGSMVSSFSMIDSVSKAIADSSFVRDGLHGGALYQWIFFASGPQLFELKNTSTPPEKSEISVGSSTRYYEVFFELAEAIVLHEKNYSFHQKMVILFTDGMFSDNTLEFLEPYSQIKERAEVFCIPMGSYIATETFHILELKRFDNLKNQLQLIYDHILCK